MGRATQFQWIGDSLDGLRIEFPDMGTWQLIYKYSEKTCRLYYPRPFESVAVFACEKMGGEDEGRRAIMKIRTEILEEEFPEPDYIKDWVPAEDVNDVTIFEIDNLKKLTQAGCTCTPRLLAYQRLLQNEDMWLPGGYMVCILMELVPGVDLSQFWELQRSERDRARKAFRTALEEVWKLTRLNPGDLNPANIIWDYTKGKCYIVDFEVCDEYEDEPEHELIFTDREYIVWGLARRDISTNTLRL